MPRQNITNLRLTKDKRYWPSLAGPGPNGERFESKAFAEAEDADRVVSTRRAAKNAPLLDIVESRSAKLLAYRLTYGRRGKKPPKSMSSSACMRKLRNRLGSQLYRLVDRYKGQVTAFTVIKRGWEFSPWKLPRVDVENLLNSFISDLNRRSAGKAKGWLIAFIHGEWETPANIYRLHLHGVVAGEMIEVVDRLRKGRQYKTREGDGVGRRVRIRREPLTHLPYPLTYLAKAYWPSKHVIVGENGKRRTRRHKRIPEPYHTLVMQFLDRHSPNDFVVMKNVCVEGGRFRLSDRGRKP